MEVTIQRAPSYPPAEYEISTPGIIYTARKKYFSWHDQIQVFGTREQELARIQGRFSFLSAGYDFTLSGGESYRFEAQSTWKGVYTCRSGKENYVLYAHRSLNYSVFQGDNQIAAFSKNSVQIGNGEQYDVRMNDDANVLVIVCLVLIVDAESGYNSASVTIDFGNVGPEGRQFDNSWEPG